MASNLTAIIKADTSGFAEEIKAAKYMVNKFTNEMKQSGSAVSGVCNEQVQAYNRVVNGLTKVANGTKTTKQAQKELQNQIQELKIQWANLSNEARKGEFGQSVADTLRVAKQQLSVLNQQLDQTANKMDKVSSKSRKNSGFKGKGKKGIDVSAVTGAMTDLGIEGASSLNTIANMGSALVNPYTAAAAAVAGVTYAVVDFNNKASEQTNKVAELMGIHGQNAVALRNEVISISDTYGQDFGEVLMATNSLAKQMGISFKEASEKIALGFASGANASGQFLEMVKEYPAYMREAGISADGFIAIMQKSVQDGVFSDKGVDAIKEANLRLREMPKATQDALNAIGLSSTQITQSLRNGSTTTFEVMQQVSKKLKELPATSQEVGQAIADIFGGPGEDAGLQFLQTLDEIDTSEEGIISKMTEQEKATYDLQKSEAALQSSLTSLFGVSEGGWSTMITQLRADVAKSLADTINKFINLYNKSVTVRGGIQGLIAIFKSLWYVAVAVCKGIGDSLADIAYAMDAAFEGNWDEALKHLNNIEVDFKARFDFSDKQIEEEWKRAKEETLNGQIEYITYTEEGTNKPPKPSPVGGNNGKGNNGKGNNGSNGSLSKIMADVIKQTDEFEKEITKKLKEEAQKKVDAINKAREEADKLIMEHGKTKEPSSYDKAVSQANFEMGKVKPYDYDEELSSLQSLMSENDKYLEQLREQKKELEENGEIGTDTYYRIQEAEKQAIENNADFTKSVIKLTKKKEEQTEKQTALEKKDRDFKNILGTVNSLSDAFSTLGSSFETPVFNIAGAVGQAIANIALGFSEAQKHPKDPWSWIAFAAAGLATMVSTIATIKSATSGYAQGGIIQGNTTVGDMNYARVNGGEMILNGTQQSRLFSILNGSGLYETASSAGIATGTVKIKGSDIYLALSNYNKKSVKSKKL